MAGASETATLLGAVPMFSGLNEKKRKTMAAQGKEFSYKPGTMIVDEGSMGVGFYLVLDGRVQVKRGGKVLAQLGKGQFFGEMSLIDQQPRSADVMAVEPTKCWALSAWSFDSIVKANPDIALVMLKEMVKRLRAAQSSPIF